MGINTNFLTHCINTLESAFDQLQQREPGAPGGLDQEQRREDDSAN